MRPFFSIRIAWNPADSIDQTDRDGFSVRRSVARQVKPCPVFSANKKKRAAPLRHDTSTLVHAITSCIEDLSREARWTLPDLISDIVFDLANGQDLEQQVLGLAKIAVDGCEDEFLDRLQEMIDVGRSKAKDRSPKTN